MTSARTRPVAYPRRLVPSDERELVAFLARRPADNAYLLGLVARGGLDDTTMGAFVAWTEQGRINGVALLGSNLVLSHGIPAEGLAAFVELTRVSPWGVRVIVGPDAATGAFAAALALPRVELERAGQVLLQVDRRTLPRDARSVELRPVQPTEIDQMMALDLAMVREELGIDPFASDMQGYQRAWQRRINEWRAWVAGPVGGPLQCKVDQAAVSDHVVQLAGVYTAPDFRRRGLARAVVGEMCHLLLREVTRVVLYVNADNTPALRLYRSLGFYEVGRVRSVWLAG